MPRTDHPNAARIRQLMAYGGREADIHKLAGHSFHQDSELSAARLDGMLRILPVDGHGSHPLVSEARADLKRLRALAHQHHLKAAELREPQAVSDNYRGLPLPPMTAKELARHKSLKTPDDDPAAVHTHVIDVSEARINGLTRKIEKERTKFRWEANIKNLPGYDERIAALKAERKPLKGLRQLHIKARTDLASRPALHYPSPPRPPSPKPLSMPRTEGGR